MNLHNFRVMALLEAAEDEEKKKKKAADKKGEDADEEPRVTARR